MEKRGISFGLKKLTFTAALLATFGSNAVQAQDQGWYMGIGIGQSKAKQIASCSDLGALLTPSSSCSTEDTSSGKKLFGGYQFDQYVAVEAGYVDLGKFTLSASNNFPSPPPLFTASGSDTVKGYSVDAVGTWPITAEFALLGRIGVFRWTLEDSATASAVTTVSTSDKATGTGADFGVGAKYDFDKNMGVRAEFQRFKSIGNNTTGKSDVDLISASFVYRFR